MTRKILTVAVSLLISAPLLADTILTVPLPGAPRPGAANPPTTLRIPGTFGFEIPLPAPPPQPPGGVSTESVPLSGPTIQGGATGTPPTVQVDPRSVNPRDLPLDLNPGNPSTAGGGNPPPQGGDARVSGPSGPAPATGMTPDVATGSETGGSPAIPGAPETAAPHGQPANSVYPVNVPDHDDRRLGELIDRTDREADEILQPRGPRNHVNVYATPRSQAVEEREVAAYIDRLRAYGPGPVQRAAQDEPDPGNYRIGDLAARLPQSRYGTRFDCKNKTPAQIEALVMEYMSQFEFDGYRAPASLPIYLEDGSDPARGIRVGLNRLTLEFACIGNNIHLVRVYGRTTAITNIDAVESRDERLAEEIEPLSPTANLRNVFATEFRTAANKDWYRSLPRTGEEGIGEEDVRAPEPEPEPARAPEPAPAAGSDTAPDDPTDQASDEWEELVAAIDEIMEREFDADAANQPAADGDDSDRFRYDYDGFRREAREVPRLDEADEPANPAPENPVPEEYRDDPYDRVAWLASRKDEAVPSGRTYYDELIGRTDTAVTIDAEGHTYVETFGDLSDAMRARYAQEEERLVRNLREREARDASNRESQQALQERLDAIEAEQAAADRRIAEREARERRRAEIEDLERAFEHLQSELNAAIASGDRDRQRQIEQRYDTLHQKANEILMPLDWEQAGMDAAEEQGFRERVDQHRSDAAHERLDQVNNLFLREAEIARQNRTVVSGVGNFLVGVGEALLDTVIEPVALVSDVVRYARDDLPGKPRSGLLNFAMNSEATEYHPAVRGVALEAEMAGAMLAMIPAWVESLYAGDMRSAGNLTVGLVEAGSGVYHLPAAGRRIISGAGSMRTGLRNGAAKAVESIDNWRADRSATPATVVDDVFRQEARVLARANASFPIGYEPDVPWTQADFRQLEDLLYKEYVNAGELDDPAVWGRAFRQVIPEANYQPVASRTADTRPDLEPVIEGIPGTETVDVPAVAPAVGGGTGTERVANPRASRLEDRGRQPAVEFDVADGAGRIEPELANIPEVDVDRMRDDLSIDRLRLSIWREMVERTDFPEDLH